MTGTERRLHPHLTHEAQSGEGQQASERRTVRETREREKTNSLVDQLMIHEEFDVMMVAIMMLCLCYIVVVVVVYSARAVVLFVLF